MISKSNFSLTGVLFSTLVSCVWLYSSSAIVSSVPFFKSSCAFICRLEREAFSSFLAILGSVEDLLVSVSATLESFIPDVSSL